MSHGSMEDASNTTLSTIIPRKRQASYTLKRAQTSFDLTIRGFLEFLTRVAILIQANTDISAAGTTPRPPVDIFGRVRRAVQKEMTPADYVSSAVGVMLRKMDISGGKRKLLSAERRSVNIRQFVYK